MNARKMTPADYAELGLPPPDHLLVEEVVAEACAFGRAGFWTTPDGKFMSASPRPGFTLWSEPEPAVRPRCDECGDETGQCGCRL